MYCPQPLTKQVMENIILQLSFEKDGCYNLGILSYSTHTTYRSWIEEQGSPIFKFLFQQCIYTAKIETVFIFIFF